jgi:hypothetical protein
MRNAFLPRKLRVLTGIIALALGGPLAAGELEITVTSNQPAGGFAFSPVWIGLHDGTFTTYTPGTKASAALEAVAELGDSSGLQAAFAGHGVPTVVGGSPYGPGSSVSTTVNVANPSTDQYLSFAAMVVPSNDFFIGNANPLAFHVYGASGQFLGPLTIQIYGRNVWDAGTEVDNINHGAAFIVGDNATDHVAENGTINPVFGGSIDYTSYLNSILGKETPYNYTIAHLISPNDLLATIQVSSVPEPSTLILLGVGSTGAVFARRWWRRRFQAVR